MHIKFAKLPVFNQDRAIEFYTANLPCSVAIDADYEDDRWRWVELKFGNADTTLQFEKRKNDTDGEKPELVLVDANLEDTVAALRSNNAEIITAPTEAPWNPEERFAEFRDSEGNRMVLTTG